MINSLLLKIGGGALVVAIGMIVLLTAQNSALRTELAVSKQNIAAYSDSLRVVKTNSGELAQKYAFQKDLSDSLKNVVGLQGQRLLAQIQVTANLQAQLSSSKPTVVVMQGDSLLGHRFDKTLADSGVSIALSDTVTFLKKDSIWTAENQFSVSAQMKLVLRLTRTKDNLMTGSVQSLSPLVSIADLRTVVDNQYVVPEPGFWDKIRIDFTVGSRLHDMSARGSGVLWYDKYGAGVDVEGHQSPYYKVGYSIRF